MRIESNSALFVLGVGLIVASSILALVLEPAGTVLFLLMVTLAAAISCVVPIAAAALMARASGGTVRFRRLGRAADRRYQAHKNRRPRRRGR